MILLDTSVLMDALAGPRRSAPALRRAIARGERVMLTALVLYEWQRGLRLPEELAAQEALSPAKSALGFGPEEAAIAVALFREVPRPRRREIELAIAASAIAWEATLWTRNVADFADLPGLRVAGPGA